MRDIVITAQWKATHSTQSYESDLTQFSTS